MPGTRLIVLAKEVGVAPDVALTTAKKLGIAVASHASVVSEPDAQKIRDALLKAEAKATGKPVPLTEEEKAAAQKKAEEEAARKAAAMRERQQREEERARRQGFKPEFGEPAPFAGLEKDVNGTAEHATIDAVSKPEESLFGEEAEPVEPTVAQPAPEPQSTSSLKGLSDQIGSEKARLSAAKAERAAKEKAARTASEVAKKQAVEEALRSKGKGTPRSQDTGSSQRPGNAVPPAPKPVAPQPSKKYNALLDQIESEKARMGRQEGARQQGSAKPQGGKSQAGAQGSDRPRAPKPAAATDKPRTNGQPQNQAPAPSAGARRPNGGKQPAYGEERENRGGKKASKRNGSRHTQLVPELEIFGMDDEGEDRYAAMAANAERIQHDKVLADARAAVAAASTHENEGRRKKRKEKREAENRERLEIQAIERGIDPSLVLDASVIEVPQGATVSKFAELLKVAPNDIIKRLFMLGQALTLTQSMNDELIELIADDMGRKVRVVSPEEEYAVVYHDSEEDLKPRRPVVTVMGHVDHGKTSLLDAIRNTGVAAGEAGGITQRIGASVANINGNDITFIDTPGHEAFTAMRARGAQVTDVIVLVVAADDGVMPQTIEAINHAKAANVPIVVAVNKIDKNGANPEKVRHELVDYGVIPEEWGGSNMFVEVSAKQKLGIDDLLETIILQADVLELKANPNASASGFVIEANLDKGRGPVATVLVQRGTLHPGDVVVAGSSYGRVRALVDPRGKHVQKAAPAEPVEILGLNSVPTAGDEFRVFEDERDARKLAEERALRARLAEQENKGHMSLDDLFSRIEEGKQTDLNLIVKADVQGSIEALRDAFDKMDQSEVRINIVHSAVGGITETDVTLAAASDAIIIGFNVRPTGKSKQQADHEKVDIRLYRVIYQAIEDINAARVGLLSPDIVEEDTGVAEVRETFKVPKVGTIAGCYITEGEISRDNKVRIVREGTVIFEGSIASLRRFKDDVKSVKQGYECGIGVNGYQDLKVGDTIEGYVVKEVERTE